MLSAWQTSRSKSSHSCKGTATATLSLRDTGRLGGGVGNPSLSIATYTSQTSHTHTHTLGQQRRRTSYHPLPLNCPSAPLLDGVVYVSQVSGAGTGRADRRAWACREWAMRIRYLLLLMLLSPGSRQNQKKRRHYQGMSTQKSLQRFGE